MTIKKKLFDENAEDELSKRRIFDGETTNLNNFNEVKYKWTSPLYKELISTYWIPEIISLLADKTSYSNLLEEEKNAFNESLSFLIFLDSIQATTIPSINDIITAPEISRLFAIQTFQEIVHCYAEGTEVLTDKGWKDFRNISYEDKIANYWENKSITFEKPLEIIKSYHKGEMVHIYNNKYDSLITPNHRIVYEDFNSKKTLISKAKDFKLENCNIPLSGEKTNGLNQLSLYDKLKIAFCFNYSTVVKNSSLEEGYRYEISINEDHIPYLTNLCRNNGISFFIYGEFNKTISILYPELFTKDLDEYDLSIVSSEWCREFIKEISFYDNDLIKNDSSFIIHFGNNERINNKLSSIATLGGYTVDKIIDSYIPSSYFSLQYNKYINAKNLIKEIVSYDGNIYCATVPSGMIIVRYNDKITVSGNSQAYSYILESICNKEEIRDIYYRFKKDNGLLERCRQMTDLYSSYRDNPNTEKSRAIILIASYMLEGILFFNGFYFFYSLAFNEKMTKTADEIRLIQR